MPFPRSRTSPAGFVHPACFPPLLAPNSAREIGGGRATRQPGQVRKEAALTRSGSGRSSVSYLFFERIAQDGLSRPALEFAPSVFRKSGYRFCDQDTRKLSSASRLRETIKCGSIDDRRWRSLNAPR